MPNALRYHFPKALSDAEYHWYKHYVAIASSILGKPEAIWAIDTLYQIHQNALESELLAHRPPYATTWTGDGFLIEEVDAAARP